MQKQKALQHWITCLIIIFTTTVCIGNDIGRERGMTQPGQLLGKNRSITFVGDSLGEHVSEEMWRKREKNGERIDNAKYY